jgi:aminopeptidase YwaD
MGKGYEIGNRIMGYTSVGPGKLDRAAYFCCRITRMKKFLLLLALLPVLLFAQSKKKKRLAAEKANAELLINLRNHVQFLSDDRLEGRRSGTPGEMLALEYLRKQYQDIGLEPAGSEGYVQAFPIYEGRQVDAASYLEVDGKKLTLTKDYFPLAYSAAKNLTGAPAMALSEAKQPWFKDIKEWLEENKNNPHFLIDEEIRKAVKQVTAKGATALFLYNSGTLTDQLKYDGKDKSEAVTIPVIYLTRSAMQQYFADDAATLRIRLNIAFSDKSRTAHNLIGFINNHAANTVILGAHFDHLGYGEDKNALDTVHAVHNGADDNASGSAALLELARMLKQSAPVNSNYLIMHFSGEEQGTLGSKYWTEHPTVSVQPNYMINMDMVGRYDTSHKLNIGGYGTSPVWGEIFAQEKSSLMIKLDSTGSGPSDHAVFYRTNLPVLFLFTGSHSDYHKATDDWDKINFEGQREIVKLVYDVIQKTDSKGKLPFTKTNDPQQGRSTGFKVSLGVIPDYGFTGTGMRIDGVSQGKLAEKIGLQKGDILLQLGEYNFADVNSYMQALGKFNKGDAVKLRIRRGNEEKVFDVVF